jgi:hypothetical protein
MWAFDPTAQVLIKMLQLQLTGRGEEILGLGLRAEAPARAYTRFVERPAPAGVRKFAMRTAWK